VLEADRRHSGEGEIDVSPSFRCLILQHVITYRFGHFLLLRQNFIILQQMFPLQYELQSAPNIQCLLDLAMERTFTHQRTDRPGKEREFNLNPEYIKLDLTTGPPDGERPLWKLSAYGPGKDAPQQLLEGSLEVSPEEMRVQCYLAQASGQIDAYVRTN